MIREIGATLFDATPMEVEVAAYHLDEEVVDVEFGPEIGPTVRAAATGLTASTATSKRSSSIERTIWFPT